ncbi:MAG: hypothetical protein BWY76_02508 [bacterium ADurb.Bin429]|nr:MAG: hypothetical protein BWY76_02508 [bacterium ADurb.Bin429]
MSDTPRFLDCDIAHDPTAVHDQQWRVTCSLCGASTACTEEVEAQMLAQGHYRAYHNTADVPPWLFAPLGIDATVDQYDAVNHYFGLSYARYLVLPRVVLQSMPATWQGQFVTLLCQMDDRIPGWCAADEFTVVPRVANRPLRPAPYAEYRHRRLPLTSPRCEGRVVCGVFTCNEDYCMSQQRHIAEARRMRGSKP